MVSHTAGLDIRNVVFDLGVAPATQTELDVWQNSWFPCDAVEEDRDVGFEEVPAFPSLARANCAKVSEAAETAENVEEELATPQVREPLVLHEFDGRVADGTSHLIGLPLEGQLLNIADR